jgi:hypothetical protein
VDDERAGVSAQYRSQTAAAGLFVEPDKRRRMTRHLEVKFVAVACVLTIGLLSGCSSSSGSGASTNAAAANVATTGPTSGSAPAAASSMSSASSNGAASPINVCAIFSVQAASKASGLDLSSSAADPSGAGQYGCSYSSDGTSAADLESQLDITVYTSSSPLTLDKLKASLDASASKDAPTVPITGVGDKAYAGARGTIAQAGDNRIEVAGLASDIRGDHAASNATAGAVIAAIG